LNAPRIFFTLVVALKNVYPTTNSVFPFNISDWSKSLIPPYTVHISSF